MKINAINQNNPNFKGLVDGEFKNLAIQATKRSPYVKALYGEVEQVLSDIDTFVSPAKVRAVNGGKIIPCSTRVFWDSMQSPITMKYGKNYPKNLRGKIVYKYSETIPGHRFIPPVESVEWWGKRKPAIGVVYSDVYLPDPFGTLQGMIYRFDEIKSNIKQRKIYKPFQ